MVGGRPSAIVYEESIAAGRTAFEAHDYDAVKTAFGPAGAHYGAAMSDWARAS